MYKYKFPVMLPFGYWLSAIVGMLFLDELVVNMHNPLLKAKLQLFVLITALILYVFVSKGIKWNREQPNFALEENELVNRQSQRELHNIKRALDESTIIAITDHRGIIISVNDKFCQISGYRKDELIGQDHRILNSGLHSKFFFKEMWKTIGSGEIWRGEIRNRRKDGSYYWVQTTIVPYVDDRGKPYQYVSIRSDITEQKLAEDALLISQERYKSLYKYNFNSIFLMDKSGVIINGNPAFEKLTGYSETDYQKVSFEDLVSHSCLGEVKKQLDQALHGQIERYPCTFLDRDGIEVPVMITHTPIILDGELTGIYGQAVDLTEEKKILTALKGSEERYRKLVEYSPEPIVVHIDGLIRYANPAFVKMVKARSAKELIHQSVLDFAPPGYSKIVLKRMINLQEIGRFADPVEEKVIRFDGKIIDVEVTGISIEHEGKPAILSVIHDITERKELEGKLNYLAYHDTLTGVPNRRLFQEELKKALEEADRDGCIFGVLYLDLDKFKYINDTLGHEIGDELLKQFTSRIQGCLRDSEILARMGGDEFTILLPELSEDEDAEAVAERILAVLQEKWEVGSQQITTTSSIGIATYPRAGTTARELLKNADIALYKAKENGRNTYEVF
jgi:diguanylate cyclase (GGDEF)-like protein/PAS domain S-box-containing protein